MGLRCKRCGSGEQVKNGPMRGRQRYRRRTCGPNFADAPPRGMPLAIKVTAVLLYLSGLSMDRTARLLGVSTPSVMAWVEQLAKAYAEARARGPGLGGRAGRGVALPKKGQQALGLEGSGSCFRASG